ncbi:Hsp20/alpha crystallin family protein [Ottowia sp.]|uniref:Hsp20/alpha crystallin family protein n=1 Tax=Ottowia sp. TaxID=1898956 RepID=UPI002CA2AF56|nr:Hsp20/alpha crystallin family protein [Ottowia sp.]HOB67419.1 Hsp20/alpha crystallin family protein [Ottowia sp.]HPZ57545.1 Hsp20/alpha crystallin family protein [Ottowia sp.]HQD46969.1 Hsp20/alpha crystallin family protein [Ottowia sp.]
MFITATSAPVGRRSVYAPALRSLDRFLNDALTAARTAGTQFKEEDKHWSLSVDLPGVSREQLAIAIEGQTVKIHTVEGAPRQYAKVYEFNQDVDAAASSAKLEHGVLTLTLAKRVPQSNATTLEIN